MTHIPKKNPTLEGDPRAPTASAGDSDTTIATTAFVAAADKSLRQIVPFDSSGNFTKATYPWLKRVRAHVQGAGGGSGGIAATGASQQVSSGGGGGGGYVTELIEVASLAASETVTVGAGGAGGTAGNNNGSAGGSSSFGTFIAASGGGGGTGGTATGTTNNNHAAGGTSGTFTTAGDFFVDGDGGGTGSCILGNRIPSGYGGGSHLGGIQRGVLDTPQSGRTHGGGASGNTNAASLAAEAGVDGDDGFVYLELFG